MSKDPYHLLRLLIREEMDFYANHMGQGYKNMGSSSSGEVEIDHRLEELQAVEGQIQQLEVTPLRIVGPDDQRKLEALKARKAELEQEISDIKALG